VRFSDGLARFNRLIFNRLVRTFAGRRLSPVALVTHCGRRSGRRYRTPVLAMPVDGGFVVALFYGADRDWVRNVLAAGGGTIQRGGRRVELADPRLLDADDAMALVPLVLRPALRLLHVRQVLRLSAA
jgi:deazaflavin-dependent oxidoreductase (nitroreductase family)